MEQETLAGIVQKIHDSGAKFLRCSEDEIKQLEDLYQICLPETYRDFLRIMGHGAGRLFVGSDCFYRHLAGLKDAANELLAENNLQPLPDDTFVCWMHQGYQFCFFKIDGNDNPPVYYFTEVEQPNKIVCIAESFTQWLVECGGIDIN